MHSLMLEITECPLEAQGLGELGHATPSTRCETHVAKHMDTPNIFLEFSMVFQ